MASHILLKGGRVLIHGEDDHVTAVETDILIEDDVIVRLEENISHIPSARVIDCTGKIVSPGFIDTHHHGWQTHMKGLHADETLVDYFVTGAFISSLYTPEEVFWGQISGCCEMIDAGTTTVVDHAHINVSPEHCKPSTPIPVVASWQPDFSFNEDIFSNSTMETFDKLAATAPFGPNGRVRLGFGFDGLYLPGSVIASIFERVRKRGAHLITCHSTWHTVCMGHRKSALDILAHHQLLGPDVLVSHSNTPNLETMRLVQNSGAHISSTPITELQTAQGTPICFEPGFFQHSSLGCDCHSISTASMPTQMLVALQHARAQRHAAFSAQGKWAKHIGPTVEQAYNLGTINGARAIGMDKEIGTLAVGKKADIVIFDGSTPSMLGAAQENPVAAIVLHSSIRDVSMVIVDGHIRKEHGKIVDLKAPRRFDDREMSAGEILSWTEIAKELEKGREAIKAKREAVVDREILRRGILDLWHMNKAGMAETL